MFLPWAVVVYALVGTVKKKKIWREQELNFRYIECEVAQVI